MYEEELWTSRLLREESHGWRVGSRGSEQAEHCWGGRKCIREQRKQAAWSWLFMVETEEKMLSGKGNGVHQRLKVYQLSVQSVWWDVQKFKWYAPRVVSLYMQVCSMGPIPAESSTETLVKWQGLNFLSLILMETFMAEVYKHFNSFNFLELLKLFESSSSWLLLILVDILLTLPHRWGSSILLSYFGVFCTSPWFSRFLTQYWIDALLNDCFVDLLYL